MDGKTYSNECMMDCEGAELDYYGKCREKCDCPEYYDPVCGYNGKTYDNECFAEYENIEIKHYGRCRVRKFGSSLY